MECAYYDRAVCRSCRWLAEPYQAQLERKWAVARAAVPAAEWLEPVASRESGFRNKAKMVVAGTLDAPSVGILDAHGRGVDLRECGLHTPGIRAALPHLADFVTTARLEPYDVPSRRGELKHVLLTESPDGELMVRWVLRSTEAVARLRKHLPALRDRVLAIAVVSANILPEHKAALEGETEIPLTESQHLRMALGGVALYLRPQGFFQTNSEIATVLYARAREWVDALAPRLLWDLYCGVGGFALACASPADDVLPADDVPAHDGTTAADDVPTSLRDVPPVPAPRRAVVGVETTEAAVVAARRSAAEAGLAARFLAADATTFALESETAPDVVVVNPPRRGIGPELAAWLEASATSVLYSSCDATSLARDLAAMPSLAPVRAQVFDMFPQTDHFETLVLLQRD